MLGLWAEDDDSHASHKNKILRRFIIEMFAVSLQDCPQRCMPRRIHALCSPLPD